jgi:hypothetical protein
MLRGVLPRPIPAWLGATFWLGAAFLVAALIGGLPAAGFAEEEAEEAVDVPLIAPEVEALPTEDEPPEVLPDGEDAAALAEESEPGQGAGDVRGSRRLEGEVSGDLTGELLWGLVDPWQTKGIQVHGATRPGGPVGPDAEDEVRVHGADEGEEGIRVHGADEDEEGIRVHGIGDAADEIFP